MKQTPDLLEAKHWTYPINRPKRDYQYNIVKNCLFENTIVALPTGLGKTFIAGVVMLNFYRWYPEGKVVFIAPTKPLVAQQIDACHQTCGIPGSDAAELTGETASSIRERIWKEKRVFYLTPQTLVNDLVKETCDVKDIVLLVIDEAHKASGDHAYNQIVRWMMAKNPHFRILALTATPGSTPDAVQALVDGLYISRIEIRDESSLDLKSYIHEKIIKQHVIESTEPILKLQRLLSKLMESVMRPLKDKGILFPNANPLTMHPYAAQGKIPSLQAHQRWAYQPLSMTASLARCMGYLVEGTISMCYKSLMELKNGGGGDGAADKRAEAKQNKLRADHHFLALMKEMEIQANAGFSSHPKMDKMEGLVLEHLSNDQSVGSTEATKVMVFVTFREGVDEIVETLNKHSPLIRATKFVGQGSDKAGKRGMLQKEQLEIIKKFKADEYNVLVATCIGEEGLDIGEVDLIVCYDAQKTPIRMLQRVGRTGRKRAGAVHVLLAAGREEYNLDKAKDAYKQVQKAIVRGENLELYADVPRMLPDHIKPECIEKTMEMEEYVREDPKRRTSKVAGSGSTTATKRKRNADVGRNFPAGASTGFVTASELIPKAKKKAKTVAELSPEDFDKAGQDDQDDLDIEAGFVSTARRTVSTSAAMKKKGKGSTLRRTATTAAESETSKARKKGRKKSPTPVLEMTLSQLSAKGVDDSDDLAIESGVQFLAPSRTRCTVSPITSLVKGVSSTDAVIELTDSEACLSDSPSLSWSPTLDRAFIADFDPSDSSEDLHLGHTRTHLVDAGTPSKVNKSIAWLIDDDEEPEIEIRSSSPFPLPVPSRSHQSIDDSVEILSPSNPRSSPRLPPPVARLHFSVDADESIEFVSPISRSHRSMHIDDSVEIISPQHLSNLNVQRRPGPLKEKNIDTTPPSSFPVRPCGPARVKRALSPTQDLPATQLPKRSRLHKRNTSKPSSPSSDNIRAKKPKVARKHNPLFDFEADHSGDEVSSGSSNSDDSEDESDRLFLQELSATQASPSYDQSLAYRQSLMTQAPNGLDFKNRPVRRGLFGRMSPNAQRHFISSSPTRENEEPDEYEFDSFLVDDEAEISYDGNPDDI